MLKRHVPLIGIVTSLCLLGVAAAYYPGGTTASANTAGYHWTQNYLSSLFARRALNGADNPARRVAIPAMFILCVSIGALFKSISSTDTSSIRRKTIEIGGIGSMVYAFLVVTPMHNLMVNVAVPFALIALLATLHLLYAGRRRFLFVGGTVSVALLLLTAAMYYGNVLLGLLPIMQKVSLVACVAWLVAVYYASGTFSMPGRLA